MVTALAHARPPEPAARMRLLCFPHAGGTAQVFTRWRPLLPPWLELSTIELPGRGTRADEPPITSMNAMLETLLPHALALADRPLAIFGHSMGAKIGFELARRLAALGRAPVHLFVAASPWCRFPVHGCGLHLRPRDEFVAELVRLGGTPLHLLADPSRLDPLLPTLRADFQIAVEYEPLPGPQLACPVTAFAGTLDPHIAVDDVAGWVAHTSAAFRLSRLEVGHYFVKERATDVVTQIVHSLAGA
jgi:surfactin synthase thioesterase subunit